MKKFTLLTLTCIILFGACTQRVEMPADPREAVIKLLTGSGNKRWFLVKSIVNNVQQPLTDYQKDYWIDFTIGTPQTYRGTFANRDGAEGKWRMPNTQDIPFTFTNTTRLDVPYIINSITANDLEMEYTLNFTNVREFYHAN